MKHFLRFHRLSDADFAHLDISSLCWHLSAQEQTHGKLIHPFLKRTMLQQQLAMRGRRLIK